MLKELSRRFPELYAWQVFIDDIDREQRLYLGNRDNTLSLTTMRTNITEVAARAELLVRRGNATGRSEVALDPVRPLEDQLLQALSMARLNSSPYYDLPPAASEYPQPLTLDPGASDLPLQASLIEQNASELFAAECDRVVLNSAELFLERRRQKQIHSGGLHLETERSSYYFEAALEKRPLPNTIEVHNTLSTIGFPAQELNLFVRQCVTEALLTDQAVLPPTRSQATVLLSRDATSQILHALVVQLDAAREYHRQSHLRIGDKLASARGEALSLRLDPLLPLMAESRPATREGLPALGATVIEGGEVRARFVSHRMSEYLKTPIHAVCGNLILSNGSVDFRERILKEDEVFEIVAFASLLVNSDQLTWSSEIKLGRLLHRGECVAILKGGVVSGNIRQNLEHCYFSDESCSYNVSGDGFAPPMGYRGPSHWLIHKGVSIAGHS
ncbi:MAG: hypothetical protein HS115_08855 [Spirochaetales bacterium]|nr:hypothetical protein [Spirochaetales bacterium]